MVSFRDTQPTRRQFISTALAATAAGALLSLPFNLRADGTTPSDMDSIESKMREHIAEEVRKELAKKISEKKDMDYIQKAYRLKSESSAWCALFAGEMWRRGIGEYPWKDFEWKRFGIIGDPPHRFTRNLLLWAKGSGTLLKNNPENRDKIKVGDMTVFQWKYQREGNRKEGKIIPEWAKAVPEIDNPEEYWGNHAEIVLEVTPEGVLLGGGNYHDNLGNKTATEMHGKIKGCTKERFVRWNDPDLCYFISPVTPKTLEVFASHHLQNAPKTQIASSGVDGISPR